MHDCGSSIDNWKHWNRFLKKAYELNRHFQDNWAMNLPWAKFVLGSYGKVVEVWCKIYAQIEIKDKLLVPMLDFFFLKHVG
jgi:hypothetical protein